MVEEEVTPASLVEEKVVVEEILSCLPTKNLHRLKIVCKDWLQLIMSPYFVRLHLSKANGSRIRVLGKRMDLPGIFEYKNYDKETTQLISYPPTFSWSTRILGRSVDGLIFLSDGARGFMTSVFNPSTGKCFVVQLSPPHLKDEGVYFSWFGNLSGGEYVLVLGFFCEGPYYEIMVYKFTRSSKIMNRVCSTQFITPDFMNVLEVKGTFVQGVVYWPVRFGPDKHRGYKIFAYHLGKNKHVEILPPAQFDFRLGLFVDGCSLFATFKNNSGYKLRMVELWIMKEDCWTKYADIEGSSSGIHSPLGFLPNGDLVMEVNKMRLMKYSFSHKEATPIGDFGMHINQVIMCADSLVSPDC